MKRIAILALGLYAAFLLGIAVWRPWVEPAAPFSGRWELVPFTGVSQVEDILLNTLGSALGYALFHVVSRPAVKNRPAASIAG